MGRASQTQAVQKVQYYLYFKYLTSYIHCLWSPLLSDCGVLSEPLLQYPLCRPASQGYGQLTGQLNMSTCPSLASMKSHKKNAPYQQDTTRC